MRAAAPARQSDLRRIAIVTADPQSLPDLEHFLAPSFQISIFNSAEELAQHAGSSPFDAFIADFDKLGATLAEGLESIGPLRRQFPDAVMVALTRSPNRSLKLRAAKLGLNDFFVAPVDFRELQIVLAHAIDNHATHLENTRIQEEVLSKYSFCGMIGGSSGMHKVFDAIARIAPSNATVMIRGESGTGKELVAKAIVQSSPRRDKPLVCMNCGALPENLIEAELFGHEKGAFTDAHISRPGHVELADTGTLFLDEIATLSLPLQAKLLRVLEDRSVTRIGGKTARKIDFRLVTATNEDLEEMVRTGRFREDLYFRIHVVPIDLPPLRERTGDIPVLVDHFLRLFCKANEIPLKRVEPEVMEILEQDPWPGNVRELENLIHRLVLMVEGPWIRVQHLPQQILYGNTASQEAILIPEEGIDFAVEMERIEAAYLRAALRRTGGSKTAAAALLRVNLQKVKYLARKHNIGKV